MGSRLFIVGELAEVTILLPKLMSKWTRMGANSKENMHK